MWASCPTRGRCTEKSGVGEGLAPPFFGAVLNGGRFYNRPYGSGAAPRRLDTPAGGNLIRQPLRGCHLPQRGRHVSCCRLRRRLETIPQALRAEFHLIRRLRRHLPLKGKAFSCCAAYGIEIPPRRQIVIEKRVGEGLAPPDLFGRKSRGKGKTFPCKGSEQRQPYGEQSGTGHIERPQNQDVLRAWRKGST